MPPTIAAALPRIEPIAPTLRPAPFNNPAWLFLPKYDGFRGVFYLTRHGCAMYSKRGNRFSRFPDLCDRLRSELGRREVILDGELVAIDNETLIRVPSFEEVGRDR
jgi:bifunctional non-homologous end joining protein LigD